MFQRLAFQLSTPDGALRLHRLTPSLGQETKELRVAVVVAPAAVLLRTHDWERFQGLEVAHLDPVQGEIL